MTPAPKPTPWAHWRTRAGEWRTVCISPRHAQCRAQRLRPGDPGEPATRHPRLTEPPACPPRGEDTHTKVRRDLTDPTGNSHRRSISPYRKWEVCLGTMGGLMDSETG